MDRRRGIELFYLATPLFALVDWTAGANVRAVGLAEHPGWRAAWYVGCLGVGVLMHLRPRWSLPLGLLESSTNLLLLCLSFFLPYFALADRILREEAVENPFTPAFVANLILASAVAVTSFQLYAGDRRLRVAATPPAATGSRGSRPL